MDEHLIDGMRIADRTSAPDALVDLAEEIRSLPPVTPSRRWLAASKRRLLRRFDQLRRNAQAEPPTRPNP